MWALKWLIGSAFTGYNLIADGLGAVGLRSTGAVENVSMDYVYVVMNNVQAMLTKPVIAGLVFIAVLLVKRLKFNALVVCDCRAGNNLLIKLHRVCNVD